MYAYFNGYWKNDKRFYKIGYSKWGPKNLLAERFGKEYLKKFDHVEVLAVIKYNDKDKIVAEKVIAAVEFVLKTIYPKNFFLEQYLGVPRGTFDGLTGISEMFILESESQEEQIIALFDALNRGLQKAVDNVGVRFEKKEDLYV